MRNGENAAMRLADLADRARVLGLQSKADRFLLLAWAAYDADDYEAIRQASGQLDTSAPSSRIH